MSLANARSALLWCTAINYGILLIWVLILAIPHGWMYRLWGRWVRLTPEQFDAINFGGLVFYKCLVIFFNLAPLIALWMIG